MHHIHISVGIEIHTIIEIDLIHYLKYEDQLLKIRKHFDYQKI